VIRVNLLQPNVSFLGKYRPYYLLSDTFPQKDSRPDFPQSSPKINLVPLFLETSCTLENRIEGALRWELVRLFDDFSGRKSEAILSYLASEEAREVDAWFRDDIRIAWLTVLHAASGMCDAWGYSFWSFFGKTYPRALKEWAERDRINRKALERCAEMVRAQRHSTQSESPWLSAATDCCQLEVGDLQKYEPAAAGVALDRGKPEHGDQAQDTTSTHIGVRADEQPAGEHLASAGNLYDSALAILSLPPKKPVRKVEADKKREDAA